MKNDVKTATAQPCLTAEYLRAKAEFEAQDKAGIEEGNRIIQEYLDKLETIRGGTCR